MFRSLSALIIVCTLGIPGFVEAQMSEAEGIEFFETRIRPVLVRECYGCHSDQSGQARGGLKLDTRQGLLLGGDSGPSLVPGDLDESPLWSAINYEDYNMPPGKPLSGDIIDDFRIWIEAGAPDPRGLAAGETIRSTVTAEDIRKGREFWSFKKPRKSPLPEPRQAERARGPIDHFVFARLEEKGLQPAADADPHTLLRRLCFDLTGLPPTPAQIERFLEDREADPDEAVARTVDRLLASEQFGERWGRHWLDVVRYAESTGKEVNATFPHAWRYRDYVIDSFNDDKPYSRFVQEQVAGDLLPVRNDRQWTENLIATGFLAVGPKTLTERNPRQFRADLIDDQIDVTTRVVLGVSVACARCHDHKFDPIPQQDYYAMAGVFGNTDTWYGTLDTRQNRRPGDLILLPQEDPGPFDKTLSASDIEIIKRELEELRGEYRDLARLRREARRAKNPTSEMRNAIREFARTGARIAAIQSVLDACHEDGTPKSFCMGVQPADTVRDASLLVRGEVDQPAHQVPRGFVQVIGGKKKKIRADSGGRLELACWMTDKTNPLTARVMVNRIWLHLMGQGIVRTPENFGATGLPPTHPELLDYLALQFMKHNWSIKTAIREIVTSRTYRMSSAFQADNYERDPENRWLWRASPRRLEAEALRDAMLQLSGKLDLERPRASEVARGGKTIVRNSRLQNPRDAILAAIGSGPQTGPADQRRRARRQRSRRNRGENPGSGVPTTDPVAFYRSVYLPIVRDHVPRALAVFDFAESSMVIGKRETSNTPDQGLYFLNNERVIELSRAFAGRLMDQTGSTQTQVERAFLEAYGRPATERETAAALQFFGDAADSDSRQQKLEKLGAVCQAIMAAAEFRIVN